jgi:uncharacterized membrane protein
MDYNPNDPAGASVPVNQIPPPAAAAGLSENSAAAISYLTFIPAIIFLVTEPYNKSAFTRFHAVQSIGLSIALFAWIIIGMVMIFIPILGFLIALLGDLAFLVVWIITIMKASKGEWFKLPIIGGFALAQAQK